MTSPQIGPTIMTSGSVPKWLSSPAWPIIAIGYVLSLVVVRLTVAVAALALSRPRPFPSGRFAIFCSGAATGASLCGISEAHLKQVTG